MRAGERAGERAVKPFFFGSSRRQLFGIYQAAQRMPARDVGVVLCNPFGHEAVRAHRAYRQLALQLSRAGFPVLRFDYYGTGDSGGDGGEAHLAPRLEDVGAAIDELKDMTEVPAVAVVGLRLGGTLAILSGASRRDVSLVAMWDPVVRGAPYLDELCRTQVAFMRASGGAARRQAEIAETARTGGAGLREALGYQLSDELRRELLALDLAERLSTVPRRVALVVSDDSEDQGRLLARLNRTKAAVTFDHVPSAGVWNSDEALNASVVPMEALQAIVARLT